MQVGKLVYEWTGQSGTQCVYLPWRPVLKGDWPTLVKGGASVVLYIGSIYKEFVAQGEERPWVNTYHVDAANEDDALDNLESISVIERTVHWSNIHFFRLAVRQPSPLAGSGRQRAIDEVGDRDATGESFLPSFCTVRVTFSDNVARPDQKYLRLMINENEQAGGTLESSIVTLIDTSYADPLLALPYLVSSQGATLTGSAVYPYVQNRQRGWHRRSRPGYVRGWVPV